MLNPCARESKARTGRFLREKLISYYGLFSSYEGRQGAANGQDLWGFFRDTQGFGRLDAGSRAGFTSSRPPPPSASVFQFSFILYDVVLLLLFLTFSVLVANPKKTTSHGGQSRSSSAEQGKENIIKSLAAYPPSPPPPPTLLVRRKINKITRRIYRRYAGLGRSRVRTRIPSARRLGQWVWLRKILHSRLR